MRYWRPVFAAEVGAAVCALAGTAPAAPKVGQQAPDFTVTTFVGAR